MGRETELARVASRLGEVVDRGEPRVLVMTGEAGLGKTRFATEIERFVGRYDVGSARFATGSATRTLSVHCAAYGERRRLAPLADLVRLAIGLPSDQRTPAGRGPVEERLRRVAARLARTAPGAPRLSIDLLLTLLGYADAGAADGGAPGGDGMDNEAIPGAVADLLTGLAIEAPLLIIVDDLHDATPDTVEALVVTLSRLGGSVLVLLLGRPELVRTAGVLTRLADAEVVSLPALRGVDATRLLGSYLDGGRLPIADEDRLLATAQGNPFYLAELVTLLIERGALTAAGAELDDAPAGWRLAPGSLGGRLLSRDLAAVLAARIDALPNDARSALRDAAVIGDTVPAGALDALQQRRTALDPRPASQLAGERERAVDELLQRRMLRRTRGGYAFATPLLREAAYAGIGKADLAERHAHLARWAAPTPHTGAPPLLGLAPEQLDAFIADQVERAVTLSDAVGLRTDSPSRAVGPLGVAALSRLARRAVASGEPALGAQYGDRAARLGAEELAPGRPAGPGSGAAAARPAGGGAGPGGEGQRERRRRPGAAGLGRAARRPGAPAARRRPTSRTWSGSEALADAEAAGVANERAEALRRLGMADFLGGRLAEAGSRFASAYEIAVAAGDRRSQAWSLQNLAWVTTTRGDFAGADATLASAARLFAKLGDPVGRAWVRGTTAFVRLLAGRLTEARRLANVFLPFGERVGERVGGRHATRGGGVRGRRDGRAGRG